MASVTSQTTASRPCYYCGKPVLAHLNRCPHCREEVPASGLAARPKGSRESGRGIQRGLMYMLLGGVIYYFGGGYSPMKLPIPFNPMILVYGAQLVFLAGLGLCIYGFYQKGRS